MARVQIWAQSDYQSSNYSYLSEVTREGVAPSPTHWCSSYRKGSLWVTLDYGRQLTYLLSQTFKTM